MVAGRPSPAPLGPVYPAGSALGGGWGLLWPYGTCVVGWCLDAVLRSPSSLHMHDVVRPSFLRHEAYSHSARTTLCALLSFIIIVALRIILHLRRSIAERVVNVIIRLRPGQQSSESRGDNALL